MRLFVLFIVMTLSSCAVPPGKLTDKDFHIRKYSIEIDMDDAVNNFRRGFRHCDTYNAVPDCISANNNDKVVCDVYLGDIYGGRSYYVLGRVDFIQKQHGTSVELRSLEAFYTDTDKSLFLWRMFIEGKGKEACPGLPEPQEEKAEDW